VISESIPTDLIIPDTTTESDFEDSHLKFGKKMVEEIKLMELKKLMEEIMDIGECKLKLSS
jgi:hypothetical protein